MHIALKCDCVLQVLAWITFMLIPGSKSCWKRDSLVEGYVIFVVVVSCFQQNRVFSFIRLKPLSQFECLIVIKSSLVVIHTCIQLYCYHILDRISYV